MRTRFLPSRPLSAFSLVEVVLAIGIVAFALLSIIGLFGGTMQSANQNTERRELAEAIDALRRSFQTTDFATAYDWARSGKTLLYLAYHADPAGNPDANSQTVASGWIDPDAPPHPLPALDAAKSGRWVRASLAVSPSNPSGASIPATAADYQKGMLYVLATLDVIASPNPAAPSNSGKLEATLSILR